MAVKWLTLTKNPFSMERLDLMETAKGASYAVPVLMRIICISMEMQSDGSFKLRKEIPFTPKLMSQVFGYSEAKIKRALNLLTALEIISVVEKPEDLPAWNDMTPIEDSRPIDIETVNKALIELGDGEPADLFDVKHKYGEYKNVLLSDNELDLLIREFPTSYMERIENLSAYMASTGKSYKNHVATIRNWARKETASARKKANNKATAQNAVLDVAGRWAAKRQEGRQQ